MRPALGALVCALAATVAPGGGTARAAGSVAQVRHVFVIVLENKEFAETFGPGRQ